MNDFNPIFVEDELTISKEDLQHFKICVSSKCTKWKQLERNEYIRDVSFYTHAESYSSLGDLTLKLVLHHSNHNFGVNVTFYVQTPGNYFVKNEKADRMEGGGGQRWSAVLCSLNDLLNPEKNYLANGELIIHMKALIFKNPYPYGQEKTYTNLVKLLQNDNDDRDFVIAVGAPDNAKTEIKVHKLVLGLRSRVFKRMLATNMKEKVQNRLEIIDFDVEVVQAAVEYFYDRDTFKSLNTENLIDLLLFADKYDINDLKAELEVHSLFHLYPDTLVKIANASIFVNSAALKAVCIKALNLYINQNVPFDDAETLDQDVKEKLEYDTARIVFSHDHC